MFFKVLEFILPSVLLLIVITQMIVPAMTNRPLFPFFKREKELSDELRETNQKLREEALDKEVVKRKSKLKEKNLD